MKDMTIASYTGSAAAERLFGLQRDGFILNMRHMKANYGDAVDGALADEQIILCPETYEALYCAPPRECRYKKGSRPYLEKVVCEIINGASGERELALALAAFCRDLWRRSSGEILFYGGREEELIKKGEQLCECVARLYTALLEIAGIPSRIITHTIGGHLVNEAFIEGKWGFIDPRIYLYFKGEDGRLASVCELVRNPELICDSDGELERGISPRFELDARLKKCREIYFSPLEVNTVKYYSLADAEKYSYEWSYDSELLRRGLNEIALEYAHIRALLFGTPESEAPSLVSSIPDGAKLYGDEYIFALPIGYKIAPDEVVFSVDGREVFRHTSEVAIPFIHNNSKRIYPILGQNVPISSLGLEPGRHRLTARTGEGVLPHTMCEIEFYMEEKK